jgi:hypothetical protein
MVRGLVLFWVPSMYAIMPDKTTLNLRRAGLRGGAVWPEPHASAAR